MNLNVNIFLRHEAEIWVNFLLSQKLVEISTINVHQRKALGQKPILNMIVKGTERDPSASVLQPSTIPIVRTLESRIDVHAR